MKKFCLILLLLPTMAKASLELGAGMNSTHSGRIVPSLNAAVTGSTWALSAWSSGVQNNYYYHSSFGLAWYSMGKVGDLFGGPVAFGIGLGGMYAERGFQDTGSAAEKKSDYAVGPSVRINWTFGPALYLNVDATYGLRDFGSHLFLNFQDVISTSIGVRLW